MAKCVFPSERFCEFLEFLLLTTGERHYVLRVLRPKREKHESCVSRDVCTRGEGGIFYENSKAAFVFDCRCLAHACVCVPVFYR